MPDALVNKIANSGLITLRPEEWVPSHEINLFDLKEFLFMGMILKEEEFRNMLKAHDWQQYKNKVLCVVCSVDAIIPSWAYMLVTSNASSIASEVFFGTQHQWRTQQILRHIDRIDLATYQDQRVIIKGCSDNFEVGPEVYVALTHRLTPVVKSLMFGEPCSTVPVYKRPKGA